MTHVLTFPVERVHVGDRDIKPPPPPERPLPFALVYRNAAGGTIVLFGHDRNGEPLTELRFPQPADAVTCSLIARQFREITRAIDATCHTEAE